MEDTFVRELDIELISTTKTLYLHQKTEGDVSCVVWDASIILAKYLEKINKNNPGCFKNLNVIELGAGVGCVGITAACLGANTLVTDLPETIPLLTFNVEKNKENWKDGSVEVRPLKWGALSSTDFNFIPNLILLADCIYYKESVLPLIKTLYELATEETEIILCQELRETEKQEDCWKYFVDAVKDFFDFSIVPIEEHHPTYSSNDILLIRLKKS